MRLSSPGGARGKERACQCRWRNRCRFHPWIRKNPWRRKWQPTPAFMPGEAPGLRSLAGYSPRGGTESDTTEHARSAAELSWGAAPLWMDSPGHAQEAVCGFSQHLVNSPRVCQTATPVPLLFSFPVALSPPGKESRMPWSCRSWHWFRSSDWERALRTRAEKRNRRGDELSKQNSH